MFAYYDRPLRAVVVGLFLVASVHPHNAQTAGVIRGTVLDDLGQAVEGARVIVNLQGRAGTQFEIETTPDGQFSQAGLKSGFYTVIADKGELGSEIYRVRLHDDRTVKINFLLERGRSLAPWLVAEGEREVLAAAFSAGVAANRTGSYEEALVQFGHALDLNPSCLECHFNVGVTYAATGRFTEAEEAFRDALEVKPDYAPAYYGLANIYTQQNQRDAAIAARNEANRIALVGLAAGRVQAADAVRRGITFLNAGNLADARRRFEEALERNPNFAPAHFWLGVNLTELGEMEPATRELQRYLSFEPNGTHAADAMERLRKLKR